MIPSFDLKKKQDFLCGNLILLDIQNQSETTTMELGCPLLTFFAIRSANLNWGGVWNQYPLFYHATVVFSFVEPEQPLFMHMELFTTCFESRVVLSSSSSHLFNRGLFSLLLKKANAHVMLLTMAH